LVQAQFRMTRTIVIADKYRPGAEVGTPQKSGSKQAPILPLHHQSSDLRCVIATIPYFVRQNVHQGQSVCVSEGNRPHREGTIKIIEGVFALVRLRVVDSRQASAHLVWP
jgi:hypothetical protein